MKQIRAISNRIIQFISQKSVLIILFPALIFILLKKPFEKIASETVVKFVLSFIEKTAINDIIFILIFFIIIIYFIGKPKGYIISRPASVSIILITALYAYYRFSNHIWEFIPFNYPMISGLYYADILFVLTGFNLILLIKSFIIPKTSFKKFPDAQTKLFADEPIANAEQDSLGRSDYAHEIASKINENFFKTAFAIGVNGKWGSGKTSFVNLIVNKLRSLNEDIIIIEFKPWNSNSAQSIIQDFFDTAQNAIEQYYSSLGNLLSSYAQKLLSLSENDATKTASSVIKILNGNESLSNLFNEINESIEKTGKKILFVIDDLDRLDKSEVIEVIRLVRNTASFYNSYFLVAYDRSYIVNAINSYNSHEPNLFLEKIFQIEISLPESSPDKLTTALRQQVRSFIPEIYYSELDEAIYGQSFRSAASLGKWLQTLRDVNRFSNSLQMNSKKLIGETYLVDLMNIELLRLKYPNVYEIIGKLKSRFLALRESRDKQVYSLSLDNTKEGNNKFLLNDYLTENKDFLNLTYEDISKIIGLMQSLFASDDIFSAAPHSLAISHPSKFKRYFTYALSDENLSEVEFSKARALSQTDFNKKITEWLKSGLESELKKRLEDVTDFDDKEDFEKIIRAIFFIYNKTGREHMGNISYMIDGKNLLNKLSNHDDRLVIIYYSSDNIIAGSLEYAKFLNDLLHNAPSPYLFESEILYTANQESFPGVDNFIIKQEDRNVFLLKYLTNYCNSVEQLNNYVWSLYHNCSQTIWHGTGGGSYSKETKQLPEAIDILKKFVIDKGLSGFLSSLIETEPFKRGRFIVSKFAKEFFGSWEKFEEAINKADSSKHDNLLEFQEFYQLFKEGGHSSSIPFKFKKNTPRD